MAKFGKKSKQQLVTIDNRLQIILMEAITVFDFSILAGYRDETDQNRAAAMGKSKLRYPQSKHNRKPSLAVDIVPYPVAWDDTKRFYFLAGLIKGIAQQKGFAVRWGGDWDNDGNFDDNKFNDLPHYEIV